MSIRTLMLVAVGLSAGAVSAHAAQCPPAPATPGGSVRVFTVATSPDAACWDYGAGNVPNIQDTIFGGTPVINDGKLTVPVGYSRLDKSDNALGPMEGLLTGGPSLTSGFSGTFSITKPSTYQYLIIFKSGSTPSIDPDWAAFLLPLGVTSGSWSFLPDTGQQLSHVELWGRGVVPIPAAAWLLGSGLLGLFAVGRRRKTGLVAA